MTTIVSRGNTHRGMPILTKERKSDFLRRQALHHLHAVGGPARSELEY